MKSYFFMLSFFSLLMMSPSCEMNDQPPGTNYYVSTEGNDDGKGTYDDPWKTIDKVNAVDFEAGDSILFKGGSTFEGCIILDNEDKGTAEDNIVISSYGDARAEIDAGIGSGVRISTGNHITLNNLLFRGAGRKEGNTADGIYFENSDSITINDLEVNGFQHSGVHVHKSHGARITHVYAHDNGFAGIHVTGTTIQDAENYDNSDLYIGYCIAENNPGDPSVTDNHSGNGILASSVDGGIIEYCEAFNNGWDMPWTGNGPVGIWIWDANDFIIQHCVAHHNKTAEGAHDGGGFDFDGGVSNSILQYNVSYENEGPGIGLFEFGAAKPWHGNIVRYNLSVNDAHTTQGGLRIWRAEGKGEMYGCDIYNNTIYSGNPDNYAIGILTNCPGMRFYNNIFVYEKDFLPEEHTIKDEQFLNNLYWQADGRLEIMGYPSLEAWASETGNEYLENSFKGIQRNPMLFNPGSSGLPMDPADMNPDHLRAFSLKEGSPAIDAGLNLANRFSLEMGARDLAGKSLPVDAGFDLGAIEFTR